MRYVSGIFNKIGQGRTYEVTSELSVTWCHANIWEKSGRKSKLKTLKYVFAWWIQRIIGKAVLTEMTRARERDKSGSLGGCKFICCSHCKVVIYYLMCYTKLMEVFDGEMVW